MQVKGDLVSCVLYQGCRARLPLR